MMPYRIVIDLDHPTGLYVAQHPELPGCMSHGATPQEAVCNLADARALYLEVKDEYEQQQQTITKLSGPVVFGLKP